MLIDRTFTAAVFTSNDGRDAIYNKPGIFCDGAAAGQIVIFLDKLRDRIGKIADLELYGKNARCAVLVRLRYGDIQNAFCYCHFVHTRYLSRQEKHGSMLAIIRPASAIVLFFSITGTVGAFLNVGTCMLTR